MSIKSINMHKAYYCAYRGTNCLADLSEVKIWIFVLYSFTALTGIDNISTDCTYLLDLL